MMDAYCERRSLTLGVPGVILQVIGALVFFNWTSGLGSYIAAITLLTAGAALITWGLVYYAKAKRRHPAWAAFGLLGFPGLILLQLLPEISQEESEE
jgi:hypothetical protein